MALTVWFPMRVNKCVYMLWVTAEDRPELFLTDKVSIYLVPRRNPNGFWQKCTDRAL